MNSSSLVFRDTSVTLSDRSGWMDMHACGFEMEVGSNAINERFSMDYNLHIVYCRDYWAHKSKKHSYVEADFL